MYVSRIFLRIEKKKKIRKKNSVFTEVTPDTKIPITNPTRM